jgi:F420-non-reducing hydrogenase iron-sulfur subunit
MSKLTADSRQPTGELTADSRQPAARNVVSRAGGGASGAGGEAVSCELSAVSRVGGREWQPSIVVFACNWCSYAGADTAGVSRMQHQPHFRIIRVMCSGRIEPVFVLRAFERGADGVLVSGCHFGDCHYISGNHHAVEQFEKTKNVVRLLGLEEGRLRLEWISAAEGARFAQVIDELTAQVRALGPSPWRAQPLARATIAREGIGLEKVEG